MLWLACREVKRCDACGGMDFGNVALIHATPCHDDGLFHISRLNLLEQVDACLGCGCLARCEHTIETQFLQLWQSLKRRFAAVVSTVEGARQPTCVAQQFDAVFHINVAIGGEAAKHHSIHPDFLTHGDVEPHSLNFKRRIGEIAATGADNHMQLGGVEHFARQRDLGIRWRGATFGNSGAQLYTSCASSLSCKAALQTVGAYFKFK